MHSIAALRNPIRSYAWGSRTALARLQGRPAPTAQPEAELWIGAHPSAPSEVCLGGRWRSLSEVIEESPGEVLGAGVAARFGARLPFLLKLLAVERPLSLQVHPAAEQARRGFERENAAGIPLDAPERSYRDPYPKPELVCALSEFRALTGFRPIGEILEVFTRLAIPALEPALRQLRAEPSARGLRDFLAALLALPGARRNGTLRRAREAARERVGDHPGFGLLAAGSAESPADLGALASLLLEPVRLQPGEALFLRPGEVHCYLSGLAVELSANSDNVVRGGLTAKHVDVAELIEALDFEPGPRPGPLLPESPGGASPTRRYPTPASEFELAELRPTRGEQLVPRDGEGTIALLLCVAGEARLEDAHQTRLRLGPGESALLPAAAAPWSVEGDATLYRAGVPRERRAR